MSCSSLGTEIALFQVRMLDWVRCIVFIHGGMQTPMYYDRTGTLSIYNMLVELRSKTLICHTGPSTESGPWGNNAVTRGKGAALLVNMERKQQIPGLLNSKLVLNVRSCIWIQYCNPPPPIKPIDVTLGVRLCIYRKVGWRGRGWVGVIHRLIVHGCVWSLAVEILDWYRVSQLPS